MGLALDFQLPNYQVTQLPNCRAGPLISHQNNDGISTGRYALGSLSPESLDFRLDAKVHETFTRNLGPHFTELKKNLQNFLQDLISWIYRSRRKLATVAVGLLAFVLAYHVVFGANGLVVYEQKKKEYRQLQEQNRSLEQQNQVLEQQNRALKSDPQAIEKEAREHLHYTKPGEVVYTVPTNPQPSLAPSK